MKRSAIAKLTSAQRQLLALQGEVATLAHPEKFTGALEELQVQLAELEVAYEELELQNEELQSTRQELERQRHRYRHLFEEAPFGYLVTDVHGVIEEANRAAAALIGARPDLLRGKPFFVYVAQEDRAVFRSLVPKACAGEPLGEVEITLQPRNRDPFAAVLTGVRDLDGDNRVARLRWALRDVSRTKEAEEALRASEERLRHAQRMEAVGRLAGGIAHSFNNLLAAVAFQCELLWDRLDEGDGRRSHVEQIQKAEERAAALARQLLAFGRKQTLQPRVLHLNEVIREMEPMLRRLIGEHIRLVLQLAGTDATVHVDFGQLEQVILNLVVNARDAMPAGGTLTIATGEAEITEPQSELPPGKYLQLSVADTGQGMTPEVRERLFEPFFTTKERGQGTGLGLATVHGIVHQSGGHIQVESEKGRGSRFTILLPRAEFQEEEPLKPVPVRGRRGSRGSEVVLLVEDEDNIREPAVEILRARGYQVLAAQDATEAFELAEHHPGPIHILVTDVVMPGQSGGQLAEQLVRRRPEMRVLYISGYPEDAIAHHGVLHPDQHFLQKPFPPGQFLEKVREVLDVAAAG